MKHILSTALAFFFILALFDVAPVSKAPHEFRLEASLIDTPPVSRLPPDPETPEQQTLLKLLETLVEKDRDFEQALAVIQDEKKNSGNQALLRLFEAKILARQLSFEKALELLSGVEEKDWLLLKAVVLIAMGNRDHAGAYLHHLVEKSADEDLRQIAQSLINLYREFDRHRDTDESYLWTLFAQRLGDLGEFEMSKYLVEKALKRKPEYRDAWMIKGLSELKLGRPEQAEFSLLSAYQLDPGNAQLQYLLGSTYRKLKKYQLSNQYLLYAKENTTANFAQIVFMLGENALDEEAFPLAAHYYELISDGNREDPTPLKKLIYVYAEKMGNSEKALVVAKKLVSMAPNDPESYLQLSYIQTKLGLLKEAQESLEKAEDLK